MLLKPMIAWKNTRLTNLIIASSQWLKNSSWCVAARGSVELDLRYWTTSQVIFGGVGVGKTAFAIQLIQNEFIEDYCCGPTIGAALRIDVPWCVVFSASSLFTRFMCRGLVAQAGHHQWSDLHIGLIRNIGAGPSARQHAVLPRLWVQLISVCLMRSKRSWS